MISIYREFDGEFGKVLVRRDMIAAISQIRSSAHPFKTAIRVDGKSLHVSEEYVTVRDWLLHQ